MTMHFQRFLSKALIAFLLFGSIMPISLADSFDYDEGFYDQGYEVSSQQEIYQNGSSAESSSGAFTHSIPVNIPPGRAGLQPSLAFSYNSQSSQNNNLFGYGWSMDIPYISRLNKTGVDKLYSEEYFYSSLSGELVDINLSSSSYGEYGAEVETGSFVIYEYDSGGDWTATDKSGTVYTFGSSENTRQDNPDDSTQVFKWLLEEVRDTNDNYIKYEYSKDSGEIYPSTITYTGNGSTDGIFTIDFELEARGDTFLSYATGFGVETNYRISGITVSVDGTWAHDYELEYDTGDNGVRSLLESITQSVQDEDGTQFSLPANEFTYETSTKTWTEDTGYSVPVNFINSSGNDYKGVELMDVNGDGALDMVNSGYYGSDNQHVYLNNLDDTGWTEDTDYSLPTYFWKSNGTMMKNTRSSDVNGDGFPDLIEAYIGSGSSTYQSVYLNNGDGTGWTEDTGYSVPVYFNRGYGTEEGIRTIDVNGDGMVDLLKSNGTDEEVHINNGDGTGWTEDTDYSIPVIFYQASSANYQGVDIGDINGDGLMDFIRSREGNQAVYINQGDGTGWAEDTNYNIPVYFWKYSGSQMKNTHMGDVNGDGLVDLIEAYVGSGPTFYQNVYVNNGDGTGWTQDTSYSLPIYFHRGYGAEEGVRILDANADGMMDFILSDGTDQETYINDNKKADILTSIDHSTGSTTSIEYSTSSAYENPNLPIVIDVVSEITVEDGMGDSTSTTFSYEDGEYYYASEYDRQFARFGVITKTETDRESLSYFNQGDDDGSLIGFVDKTEIYDNSGNLFHRTINTWENTDLGDDNDFVYLSQKLEMSYNGDTTHRDTATAYSYDSSTGNLTESINYGEVTGNEDGSFTDVAGNEESTTTSLSYATDSNDIIRNKVSTQTLEDDVGSTIAETKFYYDDLSHGSVDTGNLTKESHWLDTDSSWLNTTYSYNSHGLMTDLTNPNGHTTSTSYDADYLYPDTITNELSHSMSYEYDYISGQVTNHTDANGYTSETTYDGLGRILTVSVPDPTTGTTTLLSSTSYDDTSFPSYSETITTVDSISMDSRQYKDGLGRVIQEWIPTEESTPTIVDTWYDEAGRVEAQSLPYIASSSSYSGRDSSQEETSFTYDVMNRVLTETSPVGTTNTSHDDEEQTITDPNGIDKTYTYDAYGRLIQVDEENDGSTYSTSYEYDELNNLTLITDTNGNERNFTYDSLSRRISQDDLHDPSASYGTWTYSYDDNGNLLDQEDPAGQVISWTYDELDRVETEDWNDDGSDDITYIYDTATNGTGRLASVSMDAVNTSYEYDAAGNISKETRSLDSNSASTETTYDLLSRPTEVIYPDSALTVTTTYNSAGQPETLTESIFGNLLTDADYSPRGQVSYLEYGNGVTTTNTYDPAENYRLTSKITDGIYEDDPDGDGLTNDEEALQGTYPTVADTDGDGLSDGDEVNTYGSSPLVTDSDADALSDGDEVNTYGTDPTEMDTDGDGLPDSIASLDMGLVDYTPDPTLDTELDYIGTITVALVDSSLDITLTDVQFEVGGPSPSSWASVTIDDGSLDSLTETYSFTTDTLSSGAFHTIRVHATLDLGNFTFHSPIAASTIVVAADDDGDGVHNINDQCSNTSPLNSNDTINSNGCALSQRDSDIDGLTDYDELYVYGTDPNKKKSDADGLPDGLEVNVHGTDPLDSDTDNDGLLDHQEVNAYNTDPLNDDTDGDGTLDGDDADPLDPLVAWVNRMLARVGNFLIPTAHAAQSSGSIQDLTYTYDNNGNITAIADNSITPTSKDLSYGYDDLNRLTSAASSSMVSGDYSLTYTYDELGNLTYKSDVGTILYGGTGSPTPHAPTSVAGTSYTYDDNGNLTDDGTNTYTFNIKNQLESSGDLSYTYDHTGQRFLSEDTGTTEQTVYLNKYTEMRPDSAIYYIYLGSMRIASIDVLHGEAIADGTLTYTHQDHLDGTALTTDESGIVTQIYDYQPYGSQHLNLNLSDSETHYSFTGKELEKDLGLYYFEARWMSPDTGRFTSLDPMHVFAPEELIADPQQMNAYAYARNNPIYYIDPTGLLQVDTDGATEDQINQFYDSLDQLIEDVANSQEIQDYYSEQYDVDILDVLSNSDAGPDVHLNTDLDVDGWYNSVTNDISIGEDAYKKNAIGMTLIHELDHWSNDTASWFGNKNPSLNAYQDSIDRLNEFGTWAPSFQSTLNSHGYYGYTAEQILCDTCVFDSL